MGRLSDLLNKNGITSEVVEVVEDGPIALPTVDQFAEKHEQRHAEADKRKEEIRASDDPMGLVISRIVSNRGNGKEVKE